MRRIDIDVKFKDKELAKELGAKWDAVKQTWYYDDYSKLSIIAKWLPKNKVYEKIELNEKEICDRFFSLSTRFQDGKQIIEYLGFKEKNLVKKSGFCPMCDSSYNNKWVSGDVEICHKWIHAEHFDPSIYLTAKEEYMLMDYLEKNCR